MLCSNTLLYLVSTLTQEETQPLLCYHYGVGEGGGWWVVSGEVVVTVKIWAAFCRDLTQ